MQVVGVHCEISVCLLLASGAVEKSGCVWMPPDIFPLSQTGANASVGQRACQLEAHQEAEASVRLLPEPHGYNQHTLRSALSELISSLCWWTEQQLKR